MVTIDRAEDIGETKIKSPNSRPKFTLATAPDSSNPTKTIKSHVFDSVLLSLSGYFENKAKIKIVIMATNFI